MSSQDLCMTSAARPIPAPSDPLGETLHLLRLTGTLYCRSELTAPWGVALPAMEGCMMFHVVMAGGGILEVDGESPRTLRQGSIALLPHGCGHTIRSDAEAAADPLFDIPVEKVSERYEIMRHGGGGPSAHILCGVVRFDHAVAQHLIAQLPRVIHVAAFHDEDDTWLQSTLRFISREARELRPGGETIITRLADVLVIQLIRSWLDSATSAQTGWLAALRDEQLGRALSAIHRHPRQSWTVASLARVAGMSRSAFSARFTHVVGQPAMRYLTHWRMQLARTQLCETSAPLSVISARVGYESEAAFCRAFKRLFGAPPGSVRRAAASREARAASSEVPDLIDPIAP